MPWLSKLYKVETHVRVSTAFWEGKKKIKMSLFFSIYHFQAPILGIQIE